MKIGIMGAGAIGCYLGGSLIEAGHEVTLVGRDAVGAELARHGLHLTDLTGREMTLPSSRIAFSGSPAALAGCEAVLVTVKSPATAEAARELAPHLAAGAVVVSFQNGVENPALLRAGLPGHRILAGMVPFNVLRKENGHFHRGTSGALVVEASGDGVEAPLAASLRQAGFEVECRVDVLAVAWGKLLVNLGNALNALTGRPLRQQLSQRAYRVIYSRAMAEGVAVLRSAGIRPSMPLPLPPRLVPVLLRLPNFLYRRIVRSMVQVDPLARSSMWEDLERGRATEIDQLNGQVVRLAAAQGLRAPVNEAIVALVREAEAARRGSPQLSVSELARRLSERGRS